MIETIGLYWSDWQQTAIDNTRYSVVLAVFAIFIGGFIMSILKKKKITNLVEQVTQEKLSLEKSEYERVSLLKKQDDDLAHITDIRHQLEKEREMHQSVTAKKDELFIISSHEKQQEMEGVSSELTEKKVLIDQLKSELKLQQSKVALHVDVQENVLEIEKDASQLAAELVAVKQQLKIEIDKNNEQLEQFGALKKTDNTDIGSTVEQDLQLEKIKNTAKIEKVKKDEKTGKKNTESSSLVDGVLSWFSSADNVETANDNLTVTEEPEIVGDWQEHEQTIDQLSEQLPSKTESRERVKNNVEKEPIFEEKIEDKLVPIVGGIEESEASFSEKMADVADKMDAFSADVLQGKLKGFFNKVTGNK